MKTIILETDRMHLRKMAEDDAGKLLEIFSDPEAMKYYPSTKDKQATLEWIGWTLDNYDKYGVGLWIAEDKETGEFLGQCGIVPQEVEGVTEMEIGYLFARRVWGKGYATEAAAACRDYGFEHMKLGKIISLPDVTNIPSVKVAERIGMTVEKTISKWEKDVFVYAIRGKESSIVDFKELHNRAKAVINPRQLYESAEAGGVGAAILTAEGNVYTGVCIETACSMGFCAEHAAAAAMITNGETRILKVIAADWDGTIMSPCGRCREFLSQLDEGNKETLVKVNDNKVVTLKELLPYNWQT